MLHITDPYAGKMRNDCRAAIRQTAFVASRLMMSVMGMFQQLSSKAAPHDIIAGSQYDDKRSKLVGKEMSTRTPSLSPGEWLVSRG